MFILVLVLSLSLSPFPSPSPSPSPSSLHSASASPFSLLPSPSSRLLPSPVFVFEGAVRRGRRGVVSKQNYVTLPVTSRLKHDATPAAHLWSAHTNVGNLFGQ